MDHAGIRGSMSSMASGGAPGERPPRWRQRQRLGGCSLLRRGAPRYWRRSRRAGAIPTTKHPCTRERRDERPRTREGEQRATPWNLPQRSMAWCGSEECHNGRAKGIEEPVFSGCFLIEKRGLIGPIPWEGVVRTAEHPTGAFPLLLLLF